jgi:hypothetical protein
MIRKFNRWTNRNPLLAACLGFMFCFAVLIAAEAIDEADSQALRLQMISTARSAT